MTRFSELFGDWFNVDDPVGELNNAAWRRTQAPTLNLAGDRAPVGEARSSSLAEAAMELRLLRSPSFAGRFSLDKVERQFPVGLFDGEVRKNSMIFSGGKSCIDLIGLSGDTLRMFELKAGPNMKVGVISETFFYASVLRDAAKGGSFKFAARSSKSVVGAEDVTGCRAIEAIMLAEKFHPLVSPSMLAALNDAAERRWNKDPNRPTIRFRAEQVSSQEPFPSEAIFNWNPVNEIAARKSTAFALCCCRRRSGISITRGTEWSCSLEMKPADQTHAKWRNNCAA